MYWVTYYRGVAGPAGEAQRGEGEELCDAMPTEVGSRVGSSAQEDELHEPHNCAGGPMTWGRPLPVIPSRRVPLMNVAI